MESTKVNLRRVILISLFGSVGFFVVGSILLLALGYAHSVEEILIYGGYCFFLFLAAVPLMRWVYRNVPSRYYHWED